MKIILITQDEPFFLAENLDYLINRLPEGSSIVACCLLGPSPFGRKEGMLKKIKKTIAIFGFRFFAYYSFRFFRCKLLGGSRVRGVLEKHGITILELSQSINSRSSLETLRQYDPDLLLSVAGNEIFRKDLINLAPKGCINLHTAMLPKYRGLMPSFWVLKNSEQMTGVSVFFVDEGVDSGPIISQRAVEIGGRTQEQLIRDTKKIGMDLIVDAINKIESGEYTLIPNDRSQMSYYTFPTRKDVKAFLKAGKKFF